MTLPSFTNPDDLARARLDLPRWRDTIVAIARSHGVHGEPSAEPTGTLPVFLFPDAVLKLYAPQALFTPSGSADHFPDHDTERGVLQRLHGRLPLAVPTVLGDGTVDGWRYLVMSRIEGAPLETLLAMVPPSARLLTMHVLGEAVAAIHGVDATDLPLSLVDFDAFLADQEERVVAIERARSCPERWLRQLAPFVSSAPRGERGAVLLHTELGPSHVLARTRGPELVLEGIIDWVEAMAGDPEYDIAAVAFFIAEGDGELLGAFLDGYGWRGPRGRPLARRLLRYLLLHRYAPMVWLLRRRPVPGAESLDELAVAWMGEAT